MAACHGAAAGGTLAALPRLALAGRLAAYCSSRILLWACCTDKTHKAQPWVREPRRGVSSPHDSKVLPFPMKRRENRCDRGVSGASVTTVRFRSVFVSLRFCSDGFLCKECHAWISEAEISEQGTTAERGVVCGSGPSESGRIMGANELNPSSPDSSAEAGMETARVSSTAGCPAGQTAGLITS